jgi:hypothetical protein
MSFFRPDKTYDKRWYQKIRSEANLLNQIDWRQRAMLSVKDVVAVTGLSRATVYRLMHRADFPTVKIGFRKGVRPEALEAFLIAHEGELN